MSKATVIAPVSNDAESIIEIGHPYLAHAKIALR